MEWLEILQRKAAEVKPSEVIPTPGKVEQQPGENPSTEPGFDPWSEGWDGMPWEEMQEFFRWMKAWNKSLKRSGTNG